MSSVIFIAAFSLTVAEYHFNPLGQVEELM